MANKSKPPSLDERAANYTRLFSDYPRVHWVDAGSLVYHDEVPTPLIVDKGWLYGFWMIGREWKKEKSPIYGPYPGNYLKRIRSLFPEADPKHTLHVFKGSTKTEPDERSVDIDPRWEPTKVCDVQKNIPFDPGEFTLAYADPPYSVEDAEHYKAPMISRPKVLAQIHRVLAPGGNLVWLDQVRPIYRADHWRQWGVIGILAGTNCRVRAASLFERLTPPEKGK